MDEIAEAAPHAPFPAVEPAAGLAEIGHGGELAVDGAGGVPARVERVAGLLRRVLVFEARVDVADEICSYTQTPSAIAIHSNTQNTQSTNNRGRREGSETSHAKLTIIIIVTDDHLLHLSVLAHLAPKVLVESVEVVLQLARVHLVLGVVRRVLVQVRQQDRLRVGGLDVLARAAIAVAAGADFVVEGAVDLSEGGLIGELFLVG